MSNRDGSGPTLEELQRRLDAAWQPLDLRGRAPFEGVEGSTACMKCGETFSMTLGRVLPFTSARGSRGFLCQPCLEQVNRGRVSIGLRAFPVPLVGYRGRTLPEAPVPLSATQWRLSVDGRELLRFAALRIPPQHLGLVLASLAASSWRHIHSYAPGEPRPALAIAVLRAWCHGDATVTELAGAIDGLKQAVRTTNPRQCPPAPNNAAMAIWSALEALLMLLSPERSSALPPHETQLVNEVTRVVESVVCAEVEDAYVRGALTRSTREEILQATATLIRRQLPWPAVASNRWEYSAGLAVSGGAVLRIDGWEIGDAVAIEEFSAISGPRAVAFDAAQLGRSDYLASGAASVESEPQPKGCVMARLPGGRVRISCYGPSPSPPDIARLVPASDFQPTKPQRAPERGGAATKPKPSGRKAPSPATSMRRKRVLAPERPELHPRRENGRTAKILWAALSSVLSAGLFTHLLWGSAVGSTVTEYWVFLLSGVGLGSMIINSAMDFRRERATSQLEPWNAGGATLWAFACLVLVGWMVVAFLGGIVHVGLNLTGFEYPTAITKGLAVARSQLKDIEQGVALGFPSSKTAKAEKRRLLNAVAEDESVEEARARLRKRELTLAAYSPTPRPAEALLRLLVLEPFLMLVALLVVVRMPVFNLVLEPRSRVSPASISLGRPLGP